MCDARSKPKHYSELPHRTHICQVPTRVHVVQFWQLNGFRNRRWESGWPGTVDSYHVEIAIISALQVQASPQDQTRLALLLL